MLAYGNARDLATGLEVVLADGRIVEALSKLRKDNTGYDLKNLFIGAEGTLGIITAAALKLFPNPRSRATAFVGLADPTKALAFFRLARAALGQTVTSFELMPRIALDFVLAPRAGLARSADGAPCLVCPDRGGLAGLRRARRSADRAARRCARARPDRGRGDRRDARAAQGVLDAARKPVGGAEVRGRLDQARRVGSGRRDRRNFWPKRPPPWNASFPARAWCRSATWATATFISTSASRSARTKAAFLARWEETNALVHGIVARYSGSFSAEHGIGQMKREGLARAKDPVALDLMRRIKSTLDPDGILNPGKVL